MKLIANTAFQFRGIRREGATLTVADAILKEEIKKGKHPKSGHWMSGLLEHCTPANQETADFIEKFTGKKNTPVVKKGDEVDNSQEIREIRAELETLGVAFHPKLGLPKLRLAIIKARKETGIKKETAKEEITIED